MSDNLTPEQRSRTMSRIRRRDTKPELALRSALRQRGLTGYRVDRKSLPGRPDVSFGPARVAVFVDGAFWHGHPSAYTPGKSGEYWDEKIARNMARDKTVTEALIALGWTVLRFWDFELKRDLEQCVEAVQAAIESASLGRRQASDSISRSGTCASPSAMKGSGSISRSR